MNKDELKKIVKDHGVWLVGGAGRRADLSRADLGGVDLRGANLRDANLAGANYRGADFRRAYLHGANLAGANCRGADLSGADLSGAYLVGADLSGADLREANFHGADLRNANLRGANLRDANLAGADLRGADLCNASLRGADLHDVKYSEHTAFFALQCPEEGSFVGWKKCKDNVIVKMLIPEDAQRSSATSRKCRASKAVVLEIIGAETAVSRYDETFGYEVGKEVLPDSFDDNRWDECSNGISFFITRKEAEDY